MGREVRALAQRRPQHAVAAERALAVIRQRGPPSPVPAGLVPLRRPLPPWPGIDAPQQQVQGSRQKEDGSIAVHHTERSRGRSRSRSRSRSRTPAPRRSRWHSSSPSGGRHTGTSGARAEHAISSTGMVCSLSRSPVPHCSPSPHKRQHSRHRRSPQHHKRQHSRHKRSRSPSPHKRQRSRHRRNPSPRKRQHSRHKRSRSPSPYKRQHSRHRRSPSPHKRQHSRHRRSPQHHKRQHSRHTRSRSPSPYKRQRSRHRRNPSPHEQQRSRTKSPPPRAQQRSRSRSPPPYKGQRSRTKSPSWNRLIGCYSSSGGTPARSAGPDGGEANDGGGRAGRSTPVHSCSLPRSTAALHS